MADDSAQALRALAAVHAVHYGVDLVTAALILTRQIMPSGLFVVPQGFLLSFTGPILGGTDIVSDQAGGEFILAGLEVVTAVFLIAQVFSTAGTYVTSHRCSIVVAGTLLGTQPPIANLPGVSTKVLDQFHKQLLRHYGLRQHTARAGIRAPVGREGRADKSGSGSGPSAVSPGPTARRKGRR
ncbi:MAG: hypothetical protein OWU32_07420 [Firmicutes bacterium]|nr:hypothetical protein [Bacillota bacterium]